jgi:hypothetical protein
MRIQSVFSIIMTRQSNTYFSKHLPFQCQFSRSIWSVIQVASDLYPPCSVGNIFRNWFHGIDHRFRTFIRVGRLPLFGRFGYVKMVKFLTTKMLLLCRLSSGAPVRSDYGRLFKKWRITTCLRRSVHAWKLQRGILFPNMGGRIVSG